MVRRTSLLLLLAIAQLHAQRPAVSSARAVLASNAKALEARQRPDMAIDLWQQVLLSDPDNADALAGLARDYRLTGSVTQANDALAHLQRVSANHPVAVKAVKKEKQDVTHDTKAQLRHAGELARQGHYDDAMRIYRQLYGDNPPVDAALAYYRTLYGTGAADAQQRAIAAMRAMVRYPGGAPFSVELGAMLANDPATRGEGMHILEMHPHDAYAQAALRQALVQDAGNPASAADLRAYLHDHPDDAELAGHMKENESKVVQASAGPSM